MTRFALLLVCALAVALTFAGEADAHTGKCAHVKCPKHPNPCRYNKCNPDTGKCQPAQRANGVKCQDKNKCTINSTCQYGVCVGVAKVCKPPVNNTCADRVCNLLTGQCILTPKNEGAACNDGKACTTGDKCLAGKCIGVRKVCNATALGFGPCKTAKCVEPTGECAATNKTDGTFCGDGNRCTVNSVCMGGMCTTGQPKNCTSTQCVKRSCNPLTGRCDATFLDNVPCDDGKRCTTNDTCVNGVCRGTPVVCPTNTTTPCKVTKCNEYSGTCDIVRNAPDRTLCSDGDACTFGDTCKKGKCVGRPKCPVSTDKKSCIVSTCDPAVGSCVSSFKPDGTTCNDGRYATRNDKCVSGRCVGE